MKVSEAIKLLQRQEEAHPGEVLIDLVEENKECNIKPVSCLVRNPDKGEVTFVWMPPKLLREHLGHLGMELTEHETVANEEAK